MRKKPSAEENRLFIELTSGNVNNLFLMSVELNGVQTSCIFAYEEIPNDKEKAMFFPVALLMNDEIAKNMKLPEGIDELTLPDFDEDEEDDDLPKLNLN